MNKKLNILAPVRYPWQFNGPRASRHDICRRYFLPFNKISSKIEGITVFNPLPPRRFDLIHAFNRIPLGITPFVIGFESHLPRAFWMEQTAYFHILSNMLAAKRCRTIVAISNYARRHFLRQHEGKPWREALTAKLQVRYPSIPIPPGPDAFDAKSGDPVRLVFVGNHFGRKGGSVAVRLAEMAAKHDFPLKIDIVSGMELGSQSWVGPTRREYWKHDLELLQKLPNLRHHGRLPNREVLSLVSQAHFVLLPTFSDTFGYSVIEAMARYTPVIATRQGALPEFIEDGVNGILLDLESDEAGEWKHISRSDRQSPAYEALFDGEVERLVKETYNKIENTMRSFPSYLSLRKNARATAEKLFSQTSADAFWDDLYMKALTP